MARCWHSFNPRVLDSERAQGGVPVIMTGSRSATPGPRGSRSCKVGRCGLMGEGMRSLVAMSSGVGYRAALMTRIIAHGLGACQAPKKPTRCHLARCEDNLRPRINNLRRTRRKFLVRGLTGPLAGCSLRGMETLRPLRHTTTGTRQWCAINETGQVVEFKLVAPDGGFRGYQAYFQLKRDVIQAIKAAEV